MSSIGYFTCLAANKDAVYYVYSNNGAEGRGSITLAKSVQPPGSGLLGRSWTIISATTDPDILMANHGIDGHIDDADCHIDKNGIFTIFFYRINNGVIVQYNTTFDAPVALATSPTGTKLSYWSTICLSQPLEAEKSMELLLQPEGNAAGSIMDSKDIVTVYYQAENKMATFQYAHVKGSGLAVDIAESILSQVQMVHPKFENEAEKSKPEPVFKSSLKFRLPSESRIPVIGSLSLVGRALC